MHTSYPEDGLKISVVVPVYNGTRTLKDCLDSLMALDSPTGNYEIIVVDNNSTDSTKEIIRRYPVRYVFEEKRGRAYARNAGVQNAKADFIAFTDADCVVTKDWLTILYERIRQNENLAACGGEVIAFKQDSIFERFIEDIGLLSQRAGYERKNKWDFLRIVSANVIFRKKAIEDVGYFDENLVTSEDTDISWRIGFLGRYEFDYAPEAVVYHQHVPTFIEFCKHYFEYGWAAVVIKRKYNLLSFQLPSSNHFRGRLTALAKIFYVYLLCLLKDLFGASDKKTFLFRCIGRVCSVSFTIGEFCSAVYHACLNTKNPSEDADLWKVFQKDFAIEGNGVRWSHNGPMTWFVNDDTVHIVVFSNDMRFYHCNAVASQIWLQLAKSDSLEAALQNLQEDFDVDLETLKRDILDFLQELCDEKVLKKESAGTNFVSTLPLREAYV